MAVMEIALPATAETHQGSSEEKTPYNRLLDMMAGWAAYVDSDEKEGFTDAPGVNEKIYALHQAAGALWAGEANPEEAAEAVRAFVINQVLPALTD